MNLKRIVYPLFFVVLVLGTLIPQVHATIPTYDRSTKVDCNASSCASTSLATSAGDLIIVTIDCWSSTGSIGTTTDTLSTTFTTANSLTLAQTGFTSYTMLTGTSAGGSDTVTVNKGGCSSAFSNQFSFSVDIYSFVTGIGITNKNFGSVGSGSGSDTLTMIIQPNSFIYETLAANNGNANCPVDSGSSGQTIRDTFACAQAGGNVINGIVMDRQYTNGGSTPSTAAWSATASSSFFFHMTIELLASGASVTTVSNCYGNCGTPAVTTTNTNSTKGINFNITQTYFYENQVIFPALIVNMSAQIACSYGTAQCPYAETLTLGLYATQTQCFGAVPFTPTCPAQLVASSQTISPSKGLFTFSVNYGVFTGQWIALGFTGSRSGLQINDTNTSVNIFNTFGFPATLSNVASQGTSKAEVFAWAVGNTVIGGGIIPASSLCNQNVDFLCTLQQAACGLTPSNCLVGGLILGIIYSIVTIFFLEIVLFKLGMTMGLPGGIYILIFISWMTVWALVVGALWFIILEILTVSIIFSSFMGSLAKSQGTGRQSS